MDESRQAYLEAMGIQTWEEREANDAYQASAEDATPATKVEPATPEAEAPSPPVDETNNCSGLGWKALEQRVASCTACALHETRTQTVFGVGNRKAGLLVIGEAPGADEDRQGEPFVGRAGRLLNAMLLAIGLERDQVYIANILKCRPPNNRDPLLQEVVACRSYLRRQIELLKPRAILAVGLVAAQDLLRIDTPIGKMRGQRYSYEETGIPVIVTYHPAYLLRSPGQKAKSWEDLKIALSIISDSA